MLRKNGVQLLEIVTMYELLLAADNVTTTDLIGNGIWLLLRHPAQLQRGRLDGGRGERGRAALSELLHEARYAVEPPGLFAAAEEPVQAVFLASSPGGPTCGHPAALLAPLRCPRGRVVSPRGYEPGARPRRASSRRASG
jgi:hypothetical protein